MPSLSMPENKKPRSRSKRGDRRPNRSRSGAMTVNPTDLISDQFDNPSFHFSLLLRGNPEASIAFESTKVPPKSFKLGSTDIPTSTYAKQLILDNLLANISRVTTVEDHVTEAIESVIESTFHPTATGKERFSFSYSGSNPRTFAATTRVLPAYLPDSPSFFSTVSVALSPPSFFVASAEPSSSMASSFDCSS